MVRNIAVIVPRPARIERKRPAKSGSEKKEKRGVVSHIKRGCLPSVRGMKRKVSTFFIICDQRI